MDTSELYRSLGLNPGQLNALVRDMLAVGLGGGMDARTAWMMACLARHPDGHVYGMPHLDHDRRAANGPELRRRPQEVCASAGTGSRESRSCPKVIFSCRTRSSSRRAPPTGRFSRRSGPAGSAARLRVRCGRGFRRRGSGAVFQGVVPGLDDGPLDLGAGAGRGGVEPGLQDGLGPGCLASSSSLTRRSTPSSSSSSAGTDAAASRSQSASSAFSANQANSAGCRPSRTSVTAACGVCGVAARAARAGRGGSRGGVPGAGPGGRGRDRRCR